jgi:hypothetical protein
VGSSTSAGSESVEALLERNSCVGGWSVQLGMSQQTPETLLPGHRSTAGSVQEQRDWSDVSAYERVSDQPQEDNALLHIRELSARHALLAAVPEVCCADDEDEE